MTSSQRYRLRIEGQLDCSWLREWENLLCRHEPNPSNAAQVETVIEGPFADQAQLHGLLRRLHDLGLTLVHLQRLA